MKFKVLEEFENPMLERKQFTIEISEVNVTPTRLEVVKQFSAKQGVDPKTLIVDTIYSDFGTTIFKAYVKSYKTEAALKKIEVKNNVENWKKVMEVIYPSPKKEAKEEKKEE